MIVRLFGRRLLLATLVAASASAFAAAPARIAVTGGWTRPVAQGMTAAGYLTVANRGAFADRLIGASSPFAAKVSIHESRQVGSVMTMRAIPTLTVPGRGKVTLAPGGLHLMFEGVKRPLPVGARVPVTLIFSGAGAVRASLAVGAGPADMRM
jgi:copper(I)-binding protein